MENKTFYVKKFNYERETEIIQGLGWTINETKKLSKDAPKLDLNRFQYLECVCTRDTENPLYENQLKAESDIQDLLDKRTRVPQDILIPIFAVNKRTIFYSIVLGVGFILSILFLILFILEINKNIVGIGSAVLYVIMFLFGLFLIGTFISNIFDIKKSQDSAISNNKRLPSIIAIDDEIDLILNNLSNDKEV